MKRCVEEPGEQLEKWVLEALAETFTESQVKLVRLKLVALFVFVVLYFSCLYFHVGARENSKQISECFESFS